MVEAGNSLGEIQAVMGALSDAAGDLHWHYVKFIPIGDELLLSIDSMITWGQVGTPGGPLAHHSVRMYRIGEESSKGSTYQACARLQADYSAMGTHGIVENRHGLRALYAALVDMRARFNSRRPSTYFMYPRVFDGLPNIVARSIRESTHASRGRG